MSASIKNKLLGLLFVVVLVGGVALTIAIYDKRFVSTVPVVLRADSVGNQLMLDSDVKIRGVLVGRVSKIANVDQGAELTLDLMPGAVSNIPADVSARFLPKTLFGEKYVALVVPDGVDPTSAARTIAQGDTITQDRSAETIEINRVLDDLLPLLKAVPPQDLSATLGALSTALDGRGEQLGKNLSQLNSYVTALNTQLPALQSDISGLADFGDTYTKAAPDLLSALSTLTTTTRTVVEQQDQLRLWTSTLISASSDLSGFLEANGNNIISLSNNSRSTLELLAKYSPEIPCTAQNFTDFIPRIDQALGKDTNNPALRLTIEIVRDRGKYVPGRDDPQLNDTRGPICYPKVDPAVGNFPQYPFGTLGDGAYAPPSTNANYQGSTLPAAAGASADLGIAGSTSEQGLVSTIIGQANGVDPSAVPGWSALVAAPAMRGGQVTVK